MQRLGAVLVQQSLTRPNSFEHGNSEFNHKNQARKNVIILFVVHNIYGRVKYKCDMSVVKPKSQQGVVGVVGVRSST